MTSTDDNKETMNSSGPAGDNGTVMESDDEGTQKSETTSADKSADVAEASNESNGEQHDAGNTVSNGATPQDKYIQASLKAYDEYTTAFDGFKRYERSVNRLKKDIAVINVARVLAVIALLVIAVLFMCGVIPVDGDIIPGGRWTAAVLTVPMIIAIIIIHMVIYKAANRKYQSYQKKYVKSKSYKKACRDIIENRNDVIQSMTVFGNYMLDAWDVPLPCISDMVESLRDIKKANETSGPATNESIGLMLLMTDTIGSSLLPHNSVMDKESQKSVSDMLIPLCSLVLDTITDNVNANAKSEAGGKFSENVNNRLTSWLSGDAKVQHDDGIYA